MIRINVVAHEMVDREALIYAALAGQLAMLVSEERTERRSDPTYSRRMAQCRDVTAGRVVELLAAQEARSIAEQRYLGGHSALFPDGIDQWAEQLRLAQELAVMADRIAELDGVAPAAQTDPGAFAGRAAVLAAAIVEPARSAALEKLDEGHHALQIATSWLRSKRQPRPAVRDSDASLSVTTP